MWQRRVGRRCTPVLVKTVETVGVAATSTRRKSAQRYSSQPFANEQRPPFDILPIATNTYNLRSLNSARDVDVEVPDGIAGDRLADVPVATVSGRLTAARASQAAMQARAGQVRSARLQGIEAVVERQQRMATVAGNHRLFIAGQRR